MSAMDTEQKATQTAMRLAIGHARESLQELFSEHVFSATDIEREHVERDQILWDLIDILAPEVATLVREREDKVGYWYA